MRGEMKSLELLLPVARATAPSKGKPSPGLELSNAIRTYNREHPRAPLPECLTEVVLTRAADVAWEEGEWAALARIIS
eukprot:9167624-Lingulodinium_polyedra.AAC.1